jgi:hypothetical protein
MANEEGRRGPKKKKTIRVSSQVTGRNSMHVYRGSSNDQNRPRFQMEIRKMIVGLVFIVDPHCIQNRASSLGWSEGGKRGKGRIGVCVCVCAGRSFSSQIQQPFDCWREAGGGGNRNVVSIAFTLLLLLPPFHDGHSLAEEFPHDSLCVCVFWLG